jgi:DNA-directed RNA polymerase specialized sigma24 family protein
MKSEMHTMQGILQRLVTQLKGGFFLGANVVVRSRRFDTDAVLKKILEHDKEGFASFYERYRGRVYRFIVRQYGTSEYGKAAYYSTWRHLVVSGLTIKTPKDLKLAFYQYLGKSVQNPGMNPSRDVQSNYLPRDIEQDGNWSLILLDHFKKLTDEKKRYFLFKYEIGISETAISRALGVSRKSVEKGLAQAEAELHEAMEESGYSKKHSLHRLYRESRVVKPPATWDREIIDSFNMWLKQIEQPKQSNEAAEEKGEPEGIIEKLGKIRDQVKTRLSGISVNRRSSPKSRVRKLS